MGKNTTKITGNVLVIGNGSVVSGVTQTHSGGTRPASGGGQVPAIVRPPLDGRVMEELRAALCSAFDQDTLAEMVTFDLGKNLGELVSSGSLRSVTFKLILRAAREGWHRDLIRAACERVPGNPDLIRFCVSHPELAPEKRD